MLKILYLILAIPLFLHSLYFGITALFAFKKNPNKIKKYDPKYKFSIIIASRNEESVIANLINSLQRQDYPSDLYTIYVVPNNCTDHTEEVARKAGAEILACHEKVSSKGEVLKYAFRTLLKKDDADAYIIFDADNVVHPSFLSRMNDTLIEGYEVAQGFRDSKNPDDNWLCGSYSLYYWGQNIFFSKSRMAMGGSASINGTGFMVKRTVLEEDGFNTKTMTEDIEFTALCALHNRRIAFVEDAVTYDEHPSKFRVSWKQRSRWSIGTFQCLFGYSAKLFVKAIREKSLASFDMSLFFLFPLLQVFGAFLFLAFFIYRVASSTLNKLISSLFTYDIWFLLVSYFLCIFLAIFVVKYNKKEIKNVFSGILAFPIFMITWIPINLICMFKRKIVWEPVKHERSIAIDHLIK